MSKILDKQKENIYSIFKLVKSSHKIIDYVHDNSDIDEDTLFKLENKILGGKELGSETLNIILKTLNFHTKDEYLRDRCFDFIFDYCEYDLSEEYLYDKLTTLQLEEALKGHNNIFKEEI